MTSKRKLKLVRIIETSPGLNFRDLMRVTGMKNGVLSHHLEGLEKKGIVSVIRGPRQSRFYPPTFSEQDSKITKALRRTTPKLIIESLVLNEPLEFKEIVSSIEKSPSTTSLYLSQLLSDEIVKVKLEGRTKKYYLVDKSAIDKIADDYQPGMLDKPVSGFEGMFNSL